MGHAAREYFAHRSQIFTETVRAAFIKKHETRRTPPTEGEVIAPMRTDGSFTDHLLLLRCLLLGFRCAAGATDCHGFFACGEPFYEGAF